MASTQAVTAKLREAGFQAHIKPQGRKEGRPGYMVRKINRRAVAVMVDMYGSDFQAWSDKIESVLKAAGFRVERPFNDQTILGIA